MICFFWTALSCNFEEGLCDWYQDQTDNFDWSLLTGMDHSIGVGTNMTLHLHRIVSQVHITTYQFYILNMSYFSHSSITPSVLYINNGPDH